jgi:hypothetical protein
MDRLAIFLIGVIVGGILLAILTSNRVIDATVGSHLAGKIVYIVSIDSNATDSLYGKTWRNK